MKVGTAGWTEARGVDTRRPLFPGDGLWGVVLVLLILVVAPLEGRAAASSSRLDLSAKAWPLFRGNLQGTGVATGSAAEHGKLVTQPLLLWSYQADGDIEASAVIAKDTVFLGTFEGTFMALDLRTGLVKWKRHFEGAIQATAAVFDDLVYFGNERGVLRALRADTGEDVWSLETKAEIYASPTFWKESLLIGSYDNTLYSLNRKTGALIWKVETEGYVHGTPAIVGDLVTVSGCDGYLWLISLSDGAVRGKVALGGQVASSPAVSGGRLYVGTYENQVLAVDYRELKIVWAYEHPTRKFPYYASVALLDDVLVIGGRDKILRGLRPQTGEVLWERNTGARIDSSAVIVGQRAFLGTKNGDLIAVEARTGETQWSYETGSAIVASPAVAAGRLVIGTVDGVVYCFG